MEITQDTLSKLSNKLLPRTKDFFAPERLSSVHDVFSNNLKATRITVLSHCINTFVDSELDFNTNTNRGMGRLTDDLPRLGAYFRKNFSQLTKTELDDLRFMITELIINSYLITCLTHNKEKWGSKPEDDLCKEWIFNLSFDWFVNLSESGKMVFLAILDDDLSKIKAYFEKRNIKGGGLFSRDKTDDILIYYIASGICLYGKI